MTNEYKNILTEEIENFLAHAGFNPGNKNFRQLESTIFLAYANEGLIDNFTTELLPQVATEFSTTWRKVERNIRYAIGEAFKNGCFNEMSGFEGLNIKPTSKNFISRCTNKIKKIMENKKFKVKLAERKVQDAETISELEQQIKFYKVLNDQQN